MTEPKTKPEPQTPKTPRAPFLPKGKEDEVLATHTLKTESRKG